MDSFRLLAGSTAHKQDTLPALPKTSSIPVDVVASAEECVTIQACTFSWTREECSGGCASMEIRNSTEEPKGNRTTRLLHILVGPEKCGSFLCCCLRDDLCSVHVCGADAYHTPKIQTCVSFPFRLRGRREVHVVPLNGAHLRGTFRRPNRSTSTEKVSIDLCMSSVLFYDVCPVKWLNHTYISLFKFTWLQFTRLVTKHALSEKVPRGGHMHNDSTWDKPLSQRREVNRAPGNLRGRVTES